MDQITKNRLIGGVVLVFAGALFVPSLLTPQSNPAKPNLAIHINSTHMKSPAVNKNQPLTPVKQTLVLTSIGSPELPVQSKKQSKPSAKPFLVSLESIDDEPTQQTNKKPRTAPINTEIKATTAHWIRVASFADVSNANSLSNELKKANYPVKIQEVSLSGKTYIRVLVGPFYDTTKMQTAIDKITKSGFYPSVQN